jgi:hypothetical protein
MGAGRGRHKWLIHTSTLIKVVFLTPLPLFHSLLTPVFDVPQKPYPDAGVAQSLYSPRGPCKYAIKDGVTIPRGFLEGISPQAFAVLGGEISEVLALPLLWDAFEDTVSVNGSTISLLFFELGKEIRQKWRLCTGAEGLSEEAVNPIKKISFTVQQMGDQLMIVLHSCSTASVSTARVGSEGGPVPAEEAGGLTRDGAAGGVSGQMHNEWKISKVRYPQVLLNLVAF